METHVIIMAGGVGSRLYPLSTPERPKQFLDLLDCGRTLIQSTYDRFLDVDPDARFWILTSEEYVHFIHEQLPAIPDEQILAEPVSRNTAPCLAYACWKIRRRYPAANIVVSPADAWVPDKKAFAETIRLTLGFTDNRGGIVCIGISPTGPNTGYGYIHCPEAREGQISKVESFREKPNLETACNYLAEGGYWWNAGIFVWNVETIESEIRSHAPQIAAIMDQISGALFTPAEKQTLATLFPSCEKISIDYAVMEKSDKVFTTPAFWSWSDLGSFEAIDEVKRTLASSHQAD